MINRSTVVGVFDDRNLAERAVEELRRLGFRDDQIGFAARGEQPEGTRGVGEGGKQAGQGAATGAVSGGVVGGLVGAAISGLIPGLGPVIAGGILASVLGGAAVGAAAGGLFGALVGEGIPEEEARYYDREFRGGRTIVTVRADGRYDEAQNALRRFGAYDVHSRDRQTTGTATSPTARGYGETADLGSRDRTGLREERLDVGKRNVQAGEVRLGKDVVEEQQSIDVPVSHEEAHFERRAVSGDRPASGQIGSGEIRIPLHREVVDVGKETFVREEVELGKRSVQETQRVSDTVRREEARLDTSGDVDVQDVPTTGGGTREHQHVYDENDRCIVCGRSRRDIESARRAA